MAKHLVKRSDLNGFVCLIRVILSVFCSFFSRVSCICEVSVFSFVVKLFVVLSY